MHTKVHGQKIGRSVGAHFNVPSPILLEELGPKTKRWHVLDYEISFIGYFEHLPYNMLLDAQPPIMFRENTSLYILQDAASMALETEFIMM